MYYILRVNKQIRFINNNQIYPHCGYAFCGANLLKEVLHNDKMVVKKYPIT